MFFALKRHFDAVFILLSRFFCYIYRRMKMQIMKITASILSLLISCVCLAQNASQSLPPPAQPPPPPGLPIDSGIYVAMALGLFYGAYKLLKAKKA